MMEKLAGWGQIPVHLTAARYDHMENGKPLKAPVV